MGHGVGLAGLPQMSMSMGHGVGLARLSQISMSMGHGVGLAWLSQKSMSWICQELPLLLDDISCPTVSRPKTCLILLPFVHFALLTCPDTASQSSHHIQCLSSETDSRLAMESHPRRVLSSWEKSGKIEVDCTPQNEVISMPQ
jgi:hypothetical protein